jgi:hypothetical protein
MVWQDLKVFDTNTVLTVFYYFLLLSHSPLENQSYSNNPNSSTGRANPVLPRRVQDRLEKIGLMNKDAAPVRSSQAIDLKKSQVRNVVSFAIPSIRKDRKATLTGKQSPFE